MLRRSAFFIFIFITQIIQCQLQHSPDVKWNVIKTPHFNLIAPNNIRQTHKETANLLEHIYKPVSDSMELPRKKLNVLLFNQTAISNGYVALAPTHSAYYSTPPQDAQLVGGSDWFQTLSTHEYRHYVQFTKLNHGLTSLGSALFGDFGQAVLMNWSVPSWVFEGDAICIETALSAGGRGRLPSFTRDIRAIELEDQRIKYDKAYLGSYRTYFPNHYYLGYIMSSSIRAKYGIDNWNRAFARSAKVSIWPYGFGGGLGAYAGGRMGKSYRESLSTYDSIWTEMDVKHLTTYYETLAPKRRIYTNYEFPFILKDNTILAVKSGMADASQLVILDGNRERKIIQINALDRVHSNGDKVVWTNFISDVRFGQKGYSDIILYDIDSGERKRITSKQKYFAPSLSPDGKYIATIEYTEEMNCSLVILTADNGTVFKKIPIAANHFARMPSWSEDQNKLVFTITKGQEIAISTCDLSSEKVNHIIPFTSTNITNPIFHKNFIIYNSPELGIDVIIALDTISKEKYVVASGSYGVYDPSVSKNSNEIAFKEYSTKGFNIAYVNAQSKEWLKIDEFANVNDKFFTHLVEQEGKGDIFENYVPNDTVSDFEVKKYHPLLKSIKVHSWFPRPVNNGIGLAVFSNDFLNTTSIIGGVDYYPKSTTSRGYVDISYAKYYPIFNAGVSYGRRYEAFEDTVNNNSLTGLNESSVSFGIDLPLLLSRSTYNRQLLLSTSYNYLNQNYTEANDAGSITPTNVLFSALYGGISFINHQRAALRDINPGWGQELHIHSWLTPFEGYTYGSKLSISGLAYLPSVMHHSITLEAAFEQNNEVYQSGIYTLSTDIEFVRGYEKPYADNYFNTKAIYTLPILYPDLSIGPIIFIKRIYGSAFYDFGIASLNSSTKTYNSVGFDINFEFHPFRQLILPLSMGLRCSYLLDKEVAVFEFLMLGVAF